MAGTDDQENGSDTGDERAPIAVAMRRAAAQLGELLGTAPDAVSAMQPRDEGWTANVEVVEVERVPETTSVMATYRVELNHRGELLGYERTRRYARGGLDGR